IELIAEEEGLACTHCSMDHQDRHIWMSPKDTQTQVIEMASALQKTFPEKTDEIAKNLEELLVDLKQLDQKIHNLLDHSRRRTILVSHPAFGYFCREYGCHQLSIESEGKEPRPKHIEDILQRAAKEHTEIGIVLPQYNNKGAQLIAEKLHIPVCMIDPYSPDYFSTLLKVARCIAEAERTSPL
ncbi:MAG: zinc ABC transporter substrate-binding protein, partial [Chlamydiae bacterium]|nr:zinc ABC transporter substrate-binding protein [Chlamydiota bacterium]